MALAALALASAWVAGCGRSGRNQAQVGLALNMPAVSMTGDDVFYQQAGTLCHQLIPIGFTATVRAGVAPFPLEPWERACGHTPTRLLAGVT